MDEFSRDLDWNLLKVFHEIAQAGGVTKATAGTQLKQSAISLALKRLEERVGAVLCSRGSAGFELTPEGALVLELCSVMMSAVREIPVIATGSLAPIRGALTLGLISNLTCSKLDEALARFHANFPDVEITVAIIPSAHVAGSVMRNEIDIGLAPARIKRPELRYQFLTAESHRIYCGSNHVLHGREFSDPRDLADQHFILTGSDEPDELRAFRVQFGLGDNISIVTQHLEEAKRFAVLGTGLCFLPESYALCDAAGKSLWPLLPRDLTPSIHVYAIDNPSFPYLPRRKRLHAEFLSCLE